MTKRPKPERSSLPGSLPLADYGTQLAYRQTESEFTILQALFQATKGVFSPGPDDPKTWYGRSFRFIGLLCVYALLAAMAAVAIQNLIHGGR